MKHYRVNPIEFVINDDADIHEVFNNWIKEYANKKDPSKEFEIFEVKKVI